MTPALDGAPSNWIKSSLAKVGIDLLALESTPKEQLFGGAEKLKGRYGDMYSAGHGVAAVNAIPPFAELVDNLEKEYQAAKDRMRTIL